jgi:putative ABC transport system substrate-binding protein
MRNIVAILLLATSCTWSSTNTNTEVKPEKPEVVIYNLLSHPILNASVDGIKAGLVDEGFGEDAVHVTVVSANGEMDKLNALAREVLAGHPAVVVPVSTPVTQAVLAEASPDQNIVFSTVTNPLDVGMDKDSPNLTGVSDAVNYAANIDLLFELAPKTKVVGMVYNAGEPNSVFGVEAVRGLAAERGFTLKLATVANSGEVADATRTLIGVVDAIYVGSDNTVVSALDSLLKVAYERNIPVIASDFGSVQSGAVAAVSVDYDKVGRAVAPLVARVLRDHVRAGTLDNVVIHGDTLILNEGSANRIGLKIPEAVRARASTVLP